MPNQQKISTKRLVFLTIIGILLLLVTLFYNPGDNVTIIGGSTMGTTWSIRVDSQLDTNQTNELQSSFQLELNKLEAIFSNWNSDSELSNLLNQAHGKKHAISNELFTVFQVSKVIHRKTGGYFDITLSDIVQIWGFGDAEVALPYVKPSSTAIQAAKKTTGIEYLYLLPNRQVSLVKPLGLDLSAIAKGFALDHMAQWLKQKKYDNFLIEIGGEIIIAGQQAPDKKWLLGIANPQRPQSSLIEFLAQVNSPNDFLSIATSGTYYQFHKVENKLYSHIINPLTHAPVEHNTISVSVLHPSNMYADAWATGLLAAGAEFGSTLANQNNIMALFITYNLDNDELVILESQKMQEYMQEHKITP